MNIDQGVPLPARGPAPRWPFRQMAVGDSFCAPRSQANTVKASASMFGKRSGRKFSTRMEDDSIRCWRTA